MEKIRIVDLDNTISDDSWRIWLIDTQQEDCDDKYHSYHIHCDQDEPMNRHIVDDSPFPVVFLTARPEYMREKTVEWLKKFNFNYKQLIMRSNGDHTPSVEMKRQVVKAMKDFGIYSIEKAYDDRFEIVKMYNANNIEGVLV
jgi:hypothetical protein